MTYFGVLLHTEMNQRATYIRYQLLSSKLVVYAALMQQHVSLTA
jgi:hypothetical protein